MPAFRNIRLCGKDCICLYVCPTGATDTENSIIDVTKCISGCSACADACPSKAISIVPDSYPPQQPKADDVVAAQRALALSKVQQELMALAINTSAESAVTRQFAAALAKSNLRMAEDILRESGYMIPQGEQTTALLKSMLNETDHDFPIDAVILLIENLTK